MTTGLRRARLVFVPLLVLAGCSSAPTVQRSEFSSIRKAAIVGFTTYSQVPDPLAAVTPKGAMSNNVPNFNTFAKQTDAASTVLRDFWTTAQTKLRWTIINPDQLIKQEVYGDLYQTMMKNWKTMVTPDREYQMQFAKNVLPFEQSQSFTTDVRDHIMTTLKVDALIEVKFKSSLKSAFAVNGLGNKHGQTVASIRIYKKGVAAPIWLDKGADGAESSRGLSFLLGSYNVGQEAELFNIYNESSQLATSALFDRKAAEETKEKTQK